MTNELISHEAFRWFLTIATGGLAGSWLVYDVINMVRLRRSDPQAHDKRFGYGMGIVIGLIGLWGTLRFHDVL